MPTITVGHERNLLNPNSKTFSEREEELEKIAQQEAQARKRERNSPYKSFIQFNCEQLQNLATLASKYPNAHIILLFLLREMDMYNGVVCSYMVLQEALGMSRATVARAIKALKDTKFIAVYKSGTTSLYTVNKTVAWRSWGTNFKYAQFGANVLISETEQEKLAKTRAVKHKEITLVQDE